MRTGAITSNQISSTVSGRKSGSPARAESLLWVDSGVSMAAPANGRNCIPSVVGRQGALWSKWAAVYLHDLIAVASATETRHFRLPRSTAPPTAAGGGWPPTRFMVGLARGIIRKLDTLRQARDVAGGSTNGRALVPVKESIIEAEMDRLCLSLRPRSAVRRMVLPAAFQRRSGSRRTLRIPTWDRAGLAQSCEGQMAVTSSIMRLAPN
jgi:hypothetical protein